MAAARVHDRTGHPGHPASAGVAARLLERLQGTEAAIYRPQGDAVTALIKADDHALRYSDEFANAEKLLTVATKQGLEGIVSKKTTQPYVSGKNVGWIKVKTATWRAANKDRREMFQPKERAG